MMIEPFIAGVAGTGRTIGGRGNSIPYLNGLFGQYQTWHQQGEDERPLWLLERLRRLWQIPGMVNNGGVFDGYADQPDVHFEGTELVGLEEIMSIRHEPERAMRVLNSMYPDGNWQRPLLVGYAMPSIDVPQFTFPTRPDLAEMFKPAFVEVALRDMGSTYRTLGANVVFGLESPASLVGLHLAQTQGQDILMLARHFAANFVTFAQQLPPAVPLAIHLCRGDLGHKSWFGSIDSLQPLVVLANEIAHAFLASGLQVPMMFLPTCAGDVAPSLDERFFEPLVDLRGDIDVILANVHELRTLTPGISLEDAIEHNLFSARLATDALTQRDEGRGRLPIAVSLSCGARMDEENWYFGMSVMRGMIDVAGIHGPVIPT